MACVKIWIKAMRAILEILKFELRRQLQSPFFWGVSVLFFLLHLLTVTSVGINLGQNHRIDINGVAKILQVISAYIYLLMLPCVVFVIRSILTDFDLSTASFFYVTPVKKTEFLLGRFASALTLSFIAGLAGWLGVFLGPFMPWAAELPKGNFTSTPYLFSLFVLVLPNVFIICSLFFSVAILTRSISITFATTAVLLSGNAVVALYNETQNASWTGWADPFGTLAILLETRYWTVPELNANLPGGMLLTNRMLWLSVSSVLLAIAISRFRMEITERAGGWRKFLKREKIVSVDAEHTLEDVNVEPSYAFRDAVSQFKSQLRMDVLSVFKNPLVYVLFFGGVVTILGESVRHYNKLSHLPYYPYTRLMLEVFHFGLSPLIMMMAIWYSGALIHRESESGVAEIVGALPYADWVMPAAKTVTLCLVGVALLLTAMITSIALQVSAGYMNFELGLYLKSLFIYNGFYYGMLCVLAIAIQVLTPNKWFGMLLVFSAFVLLASLPSMGVEHVLLGFRIPFVIYSDMNGYGPASPMIYSLMVYWGFFCVLLLIGAHLLYSRSAYSTFKERFKNAGARKGRAVALCAALAGLGFAGAGGWIYYNTNVLNEYRSTYDRQRLLAEYEIEYGQYADSPAPSYQAISTKVDIYPGERRVESSGTATLRNNKDHAISEFVITLDPRMQIESLSIESAKIITSDREQGFYLFKFDEPLGPRKTVKMDWDMNRRNRGFVSGNHDYEIVENGTFLRGEDIAPVPGLNTERFIMEEGWRRRFGLGPAPRLAELGDPKYLDVLKFGVDSRSDFRVVVSTSADQIAVGPGVLQREWSEGNRRYFEYAFELPTSPSIAIASAKYEVARDQWNHVALEIYHDAKHGANIESMMTTIKRTMDTMSREFAAYPCSIFRIVEYPGYRSSATAFHGMASYPEMYGFITDNSGSKHLDYVTIHELAHQWWGGMAYGAKMQGRQMLNETLAQYSTLMIFKEHLGEEFAGKVARQFEDGYLSIRKDEPRTELSVMRTDDQGYISYNKGPLAFYALQDVIGEDRVNAALRNYLKKFAFKDPPFPTSRDVVDELRAVAGDEHEALITDLFDRIMFHDLGVESAEVRAAGDRFEVSIQVSGHQFEADELGNETEVPLNRIVEVAMFGGAAGGEGKHWIYRGRHLVQTGSQTIRVEVPEFPEAVELDPFCKVLDRNRANNVFQIQR